MDVETEIKELFASAFVSTVSIFIKHNLLRKLTVDSIQSLLGPIKPYNNNLSHVVSELILVFYSTWV